MASKPRLLFYFLHLLGVGHVYRAKRLIEGFAKAGIAVDVIYGGQPIDGIEFDAESVHFLPPIRAADNTYATYLDANGAPLDQPFKDKRREQLLDIFSGLNPDLILIEAFPFGRRMVAGELLAMFETAAKRPSPPLIVSSVRDILQERKKAGRNEETRDHIVNHFDQILVHSDPEIIQLDQTFPFIEDIADKITYTGFVVPDASTEDAKIPAYDVIVSSGGGAFGDGLLKTAREAARHRPDLKWCLATGPNMSTETVETIVKDMPPHITVVRRLENLAAHMARAKCSISQCGYNTAMDVLSVHQTSPCRAVFVPYDTEGQTEQLKRAQLLEKAGYAINLPQSELTVDRLLGAIDAAMKLPAVSHKVDFEGVKNSARIIKRWLDDRP